MKIKQTILEILALLCMFLIMPFVFILGIFIRIVDCNNSDEVVQDEE